MHQTCMYGSLRGARGNSRPYRDWAYSARTVLLTQFRSPQIQVRNTPDSRHGSEGSEHLRYVPLPDASTCSKASTPADMLQEGNIPLTGIIAVPAGAGAVYDALSDR